MTKKIVSMHPIYLLAGLSSNQKTTFISSLEERFSKEERLDSVGAQGAIFVFFGADASTTEEVIRECQTYPFLTSRKLVKVYEANALDLKSLDAYLTNPQSSTILILISSKTDKELPKTLLDKVLRVGEVIKPKLERANTAMKRLQTSLDKFGLKYDDSILNFLSDAQARYPGQLDDLIPIIKLHYPKGSILKMDELIYLVRSDKQASLFELIDILFEKNPEKAILWIYQVENHVPYFFQMLSLIFRHIKLLWFLLVLQQQGASFQRCFQEMKVPAFVLKKLMLQSKQWSIDALENMVHDLAQFDLFLKSGNPTFVMTKFEMFVLENFHPSTTVIKQVNHES